MHFNASDTSEEMLAGHIMSSNDLSVLRGLAEYLQDARKVNIVLLHLAEALVGLQSISVILFSRRQPPATK